jgi:hypothetical protein
MDLSGNVSDALLKTITATIVKKPDTISEALTLLEYIAKRDIETLVDKLRDWVIDQLKDEERTLAKKMIEDAKKEFEGIRMDIEEVKTA